MIKLLRDFGRNFCEKNIDTKKLKSTKRGREEEEDRKRECNAIQDEMKGMEIRKRKRMAKQHQQQDWRTSTINITKNNIIFSGEREHKRKVKATKPASQHA